MKNHEIKTYPLFRLFSFFFISFFLSSCGGTSLTENNSGNVSSRIIPGVFALGDAEKLTDAGARVTRIILKDTYIEDFYSVVDGGTSMVSIEKYQALKAIHDAGIDIILTIRWPEVNGSERDRVPTGTDRTESLSLLSRFLTDFGPIIDVYSLQNEVGTSSAPGSYSDADMTADSSGEIPAIAWWKDLLETATYLMETTPELSHLKIASPAPTFLKGAAFLSSTTEDFSADYHLQEEFFTKTIEFAQLNSIYLDLHLLNFTLEQMDYALDFIDDIYSGEIIVTEWSDVEGVGAWLDENMDSDFTAVYSETLDFSGNGLNTNREFIEYSYTDPVSSDVWNDFAAGVPGEADFVRESLKIMENHGVVYACWALGHQYGEPLYDVKTLYSNLSTGSSTDTNTAVYNAVKTVFLDYQDEP